MAIFPHLETETKIQVNDRIRFDGSKSFVSKGADPITIMTVAPGDDEAALSIFDTDVDERFLDWEFKTFNIDVGSNNDKLDFKEGNTVLVATIATGTFTLSTLRAEIETKLNAAGIFTYTVTLSADDKITIAATSSFSLLPSTGVNSLVSILPEIGILESSEDNDISFNNQSTITGRRIRSLNKNITLLVGDGTSTESEVTRIRLLSKDGDALFSDDSDLISHEPELLKCLPEGRNTFKNIHRRAQELIIAWFDEKGYVNVFDDKFTIDNFVKLDEVKEWSVFLVLRLIHEGNINSIDDVNSEKAKMYSSEEIIHRDRAVLRLDVDNDGVSDDFEELNPAYGTIFRR